MNADSDLEESKGDADSDIRAEKCNVLKMSSWK